MGQAVNVSRTRHMPMPAPTPHRHYQGERGQRYHVDKRSVPEVAVPWVSRLRAEKFRPHISPGNVVLEFGVGFGWNLASLVCAKKIGIDVAVEALRDFMKSRPRPDLNAIYRYAQLDRVQSVIRPYLESVMADDA